MTDSEFWIRFWIKALQWHMCILLMAALSEALTTGGRHRLSLMWATIAQAMSRMRKKEGVR
jgi:hypothetical protein